MRWRSVCFVFAAIAVLSWGVARGQNQDVPIVTIYDSQWNPVDTMTVEQSEPFTLHGLATGHTPLVYVWFLSPVGAESIRLVEGFSLIDYYIADPGNFSIRLEVADAFGQVGSDSVAVTVISHPVAVESRTWAGIRAAYR